MGCKRIPHYPKELKKEIIQKLKDGISRSDIQKEYGISPSTLSRWICPSEKIINEVNGEFRPVLENYTDKGLDKDYDADIDAENESDKSENESSQNERNADENRKKRDRESSTDDSISDENKVLRKKRRLDSNESENNSATENDSDTENESDKSENESSQYEKNADENRKKRGREFSSDENSVLRKKQRLDSNESENDSATENDSDTENKEFKKGGGNVKDHLTWSERRRLAEEAKEEKSAQFFKYAISAPMIYHFNQPRHLFVPPIISNNIIKNNILSHDKDTMSRLIRGSKARRSTTSIKKNKKAPLSTQYCDFILFLKSKDKNIIKEIVKNLPVAVINALSEIIMNVLCGNIPLNKSDIEKLRPFRKLMQSLSKKSNSASYRKKLMISKKGGSLLSIILPLAEPTLCRLISQK